MRRILGPSANAPSLVLLGGLFASVALAYGATSENQTPLLSQSAQPGADLFNDSPPRQIRIELSLHGIEGLREDSRKFVPATVSEGGQIYSNVAIHLKGSVGSFQPVDDKPAWTLDFSHFNPGQKFHGLRRIHLNNSVEDPSYCNEYLASELFRKAGVPAPRVTHAVVSLNERKLGLYVLKEGFTEGFLSCYFEHVGGDLFEPGEGHDVNQTLKRNSVHAPRGNGAGLEKLAQAALEPELPRRWERLRDVLNIDRFATFMALEILLCHRDGYCLARNNFRVYEELDTEKIQFFPHGMDQLLGSPELPWQPHMAGLVARALIETTPGKRLYRERFAEVFTNVWSTRALEGRVDRLVERLRPALADAEFASLKSEADRVKGRIAARQLNVKQQLAKPEPSIVEFREGIAGLGHWAVSDKPAEGRIEEARSPDGKPCLWILTRSETSAAWKTTAVLRRGRYRFEGRAMTAGVEPLAHGVHQGAGLRIAGQIRQSGNLVGDNSWHPLRAEFEVTQEASEVQFVCELRAKAGQVWFDLGALQVVHIP